MCGKQACGKQACGKQETLLTKIVSKTHRVKFVHQLRLYTFLSILRKTYDSPKKRKIVGDTFKILKRIKDLRDTGIYEAFTGPQIRTAWDNAGSLMTGTFAEKNTRVAEEGKPTCNICMENVADFLYVHGGTAHGGVCGSCAFRVILEPKPKCPICAQTVKMITVRSSSRACELKIYDP